MKTYDLSIILPSVNPNNWASIYYQLEESCRPYTYQLIVVGPHCPKDCAVAEEEDFLFIKDYGSPSRCFQIGVMHAEGEYVAFVPDDCIILANKGFAEAVELMRKNKTTDGVTLKYSEGSYYSGNQHLDPSYWVARTHADLRLDGVLDSWKIAPCFLYNRDYYVLLGGLDCSFEHVNMNTHDLAFRVQRAGGVMHITSDRIFKANWAPWDNNNKGPLQLAYELNDNPKFRELVADPNFNKRLRIDFNNWKQQSNFWVRRYPQYA